MWSRGIRRDVPCALRLVLYPPCCAVKGGCQETGVISEPQGTKALRRAHECAASCQVCAAELRFVDGLTEELSLRLSVCRLCQSMSHSIASHRSDLKCFWPPMKLCDAIGKRLAP
ncbi:hypothetical protein B0J13DRAFT_539775 [Dactylonectria estremocensis]|uniref:Uncharacterized protein n=1 Tax=Dactylonectria estremocensis TaxID=1079267 RepID=A0A9P9FF66_9HYPO|nr:hypothetical protein B0J13DRAFT_539775 [Dactylonectria estremocensis]